MGGFDTAGDVVIVVALIVVLLSLFFISVCRFFMAFIERNVFSLRVEIMVYASLIILYYILYILSVLLLIPRL